MVYKFDGYNYWLRMNKGERLSEGLQKFMDETNIEGAWISGIGATLEYEIGLYQTQTKDYKWKTFKNNAEILSLQGNLAKNEKGEMMFHLHGTFSDENFQANGGHVKDFVVGGTLELFIHRSYSPLQRKTDEEVQLQTLDL